MRWTPADRWDISIIADIMDTDDGKGYFKYFSGPFKTDRHEVALDGEYYFETKGNGQTLRIKYEGNAFNVLSVTGRRYYKAKHGGDIDATPLDFGSYFKTDKNDFLSEELRVSSPNKSGPFQWLIGVYGFKEETDVDFPFAAETRYTDMDTDGYAGFGQCIYTLFDRLHLTAGLRYEHLDLKGKQKYEFIDVMGTPQSLTYGKDRDFDEVLPKFSITFDFTDDIMAYASASKGYLAGGYDYAMSTGLENFAYGPEYTWNYEIGTKTSWLDKRLMLNLSLFYIDMEDKQVMEWLPGTMATKIENAAEAHSMGVELELKVRPTQGLDLFAGFGYMEAEFDDWTTTELNMTTFQFEEYDYKDKDLPNAPRYTYNLGVQYRHLSGFFGRVDLLGTGSFYGDAKNDSKIDAYQLVNLRLGYEKEKFDIVLWSKNLFDEDYDVMRVRYGTDELGMDGEPRMFGATVTYRF